MRRCGNVLGLILAAVGCAIVLALILPVGVWWFLLGVTLIIIGIKIIRC